MEALREAKQIPNSQSDLRNRETSTIPIPLDFTIPLSPAGQSLEVRILSTWGDPHYVGLSGIEIFDTKGMVIPIEDPHKQVTAVPASINVLDEYDSDPRIPENLVDGRCPFYLATIIEKLKSRKLFQIGTAVSGISMEVYEVKIRQDDQS